MEKWSLSAEMISIIAVIMMIWFSYNKEHIKTVRRTLFIAGLYVTLGSSLLNVLCTWTIENYSKVPRWVNIALNSLYFLLSITMATLVAAYLFELFLEHVYEKYCRTRAMIGTSILVGTYLVIFISNFWNGCLFWFDNHGGYHRGVLNKSGYFIMLGELILTIICYFHNRSSVEKRVIHVMRGLPALVVLMSVFQIIYPEVLMNGMIGAFVYLIIFANFQNIHVEHDSLTGIRNRKVFTVNCLSGRKADRNFR